MGEFALGQPVSRFEDPRLLRGGGRYVDDMVLPRMVLGHVLRSPHAHARIRSIDATAAKAAPGVLAVLTSADWEASGWRDLPSASGNRRRDGSSRLSAALPGAGQGSRALGRRLRRLCRRRDPPSGGGRRRADRGRIRAPARGRLYRGCGKAGRPARLGRGPRQHLFCLSRRRQGGDRRRLRRCGARRQAQIRHQPGHCGDDGAAGCHRRLQRRRGPLDDLHDPAAHPRLSRRAVADPAGAGEPGTGRRRRHRRQLWHEVGDLQRGRAGIAGLEAHRPPGQMDEHPLGGVSRRRPGP